MATPTSCGEIIRAAAKSLGAYFTAVVTADSVSPHTTLTVPQLADVAFDAERFQFWYVRRKNPAALTLSTSSAADPTTVTTSAAHLLAAGDIVLIAGHSLATRNGTFTVLTTPTATTFTIDVSSAGAGGTGGTVTIVSQYRLITTTGLPSASTITIQRAFQGVVGSVLPSGTELEFALILSWDEWKAAADAAIQDKFYRDRLSVALVADQKEYDLTVTAPWLLSKGQFIRARIRNAATAAAPYEEDIPSLYFVEADYGVKLIMPNTPSDVTGNSIIIEARHYYDAFDSDADTVTLPFRLAVAATRDEALSLIYQKLGVGAKKIYGMAKVLSGQQLAEQESRWLDNAARRDMSDEEAISVESDWYGGPGW